MDPTADLLGQLQDIDLPDPTGWWVAPGWLLLPVLLAVACWYGYRRWVDYRHHAKTNWRPEALAELGQLRSRVDSGDCDEVLAGASRLARRIAIARSTRKKVAMLTGEQWLQLLNRMGETDAFTAGAGRLLATAPYRSDRIEDKALLHGIIDAVETLVTGSAQTSEVAKADKLRGHSAAREGKSHHRTES